MEFIIVLVVLGLFVVWGIATYNGLVRHRQLVREGWSSIDVQLKRRFDLVPNLIETVKGFAAHEKDVLKGVTQARAAVATAGAGGIAQRAAGEDMLSRSLGKLFAVAEAYPELRSNQNFLQLQTELATLENEIQMARRYYNGAVRNNNTAVQSFPASIIANMFAFNAADYFELSNEGERAVPTVSF